MTTVGYGDKSPRTFWGRLVSVLWISSGIIAYGLVTGIVVSEVMKINSPPPPDMKDKNIGSLLYRDYDAMIVGQNGGLVHPERTPSPEPFDFYEDALVMINNLRRKRTKGFVMDQFTYWLFQSIGEKLLPKLNFSDYNLITPEDANKCMNFFLYDTMMKTIDYKGKELLTYGILVREKKHYDYLVYMVEHRGKVEVWNTQIAWNQYLKNIAFSRPDGLKVKGDISEKEIDVYEEESNSLFSHKEVSFRVSLGIVCALIVCVIVVGSVLEYRRTGCRKPYVCVKDTLEEEQTDTQSDDAEATKMITIDTKEL